MSDTTPNDGEEAVNLLSLDGGGVRGVSSLVILDAIMRRIRDDNHLAEVPKPCDYFHMIAGTSTGGLIAIMLGRLRMSTKEALEAYDTCAARIFSRQNKKTWSFSERFCATALKEAVEGIVKERGLGDRMRDFEFPSKGKAFVCVMPADSIGKPRMVRTFWGDSGVDDEWDEGIMIWEAARATTAASSFFKPQKLGSGETPRSYIDAAIGVNNPVEYLLKEAVEELGSGRRLGCIISIGTGTRGLKLGRALSGLRNLVQAPVFYIRLIKTLKSTATDSEETHRRLETRLLPFPGAYYRFNVPNAAEEVELHEYKKMPKLRSRTTQYLSDQDVAPQVREIAHALKTDSFDHGLTLGHVCGLDKEQVFLANTKPPEVGKTSPFFTGRKDVLERLDSFFALRNTGGKPRREILLHGMGGIGKTEIALKASEVLSHRFKYVFFVDGSTLSTISHSYAEICRKNKLGGGNTEAQQNLAMRWMEGLTQEWLLIFDDCNLSDRWHHLPGRGRGNVIYTTRSTALNDSFPADCILEIGPLSEADSVELLLRASDTQSRSPDEANTNLAMKLVKELGCLPLAIEKAAAAIRDGRSLEGYLTDLRGQKVGILSRPQFDGRKIENPTVYATLELSFKAIVARRQRGGRQAAAGCSALLAMKLLNLLSFFHHKGFPLLALKRAADERHRLDGGHTLLGIMEPNDRDFDTMISVDEDGNWMNWVLVATDILESLSLVKWDHKTNLVSMHILVHRWARHRMDKDTYLRYSLLAKVILGDAIGLTEKWTDRKFVQKIGPHAFGCIKRPSKKFDHGPYEAVFQIKIGWLFALNKRFDEAEKLFLQSLSFWKKHRGVHAPNVILALTFLGRLYDDMGRLEDAERVYLEAADGLKTRGEALMAQHAAQEPVKEPVPPTKSAPPTTPPAEPKPPTEPTPPTEAMPPTSQLSQILKIILHKWWQTKWLPQNPRRSFLESRRRNEDPTAKCVSTPETTTVTWVDSPDDEDDIWLQFHLIHAELARVFVKRQKWGLGIGRFKQISKRLAERLPEYSLERLQVEIETQVLLDPANLEFWNKRMNDWADHFLPNRDPEVMAAELTIHMELMSAFAGCCLKNRMYATAYRLYRALLDRYAETLGRYDSKVLQILRYMVICKVDADQCELAMEIAEICLRRARRCYGECHLETALALEKLFEARFYWTLELDDTTQQLLNDAVTCAEACVGENHYLSRRLRGRLGKRAAPIRLSTTSSLEEVVPVSMPAFPLEMIEEATSSPEERITIIVWPPDSSLDTGKEAASSVEEIVMTVPTPASLLVRNKNYLKKLEAEYGRHHFFYKRWVRYMRDGPITTKEELLKRRLACFGPHSSLVKSLRRELEAKARGLGEAQEDDGEPNRARGSQLRGLPGVETDQLSDDEPELPPPEPPRRPSEMSSAEKSDLYSARTHPHPARDMPLMMSDICGL